MELGGGWTGERQLSAGAAVTLQIGPGDPTGPLVECVLLGRLAPPPAQGARPLRRVGLARQPPGAIDSLHVERGGARHP